MAGGATDADVIIVGGGVAGLCAAYFARRLGKVPLIVDAGHQCASQVPTALINPVRGFGGKVVPGGLEGARFTLALIRKLESEGSTIRHGVGLWRPAPDIETRERWQSQVSASFPHAWHLPAPEHLGLRTPWPSALFLPESFWVETAPFLAALAVRAAPIQVTATVTAVDLDARSVTLSDNTVLHAPHLLGCGGALGASLGGEPAVYRPGRLLVTATPVTEVAVSYGLYSVPYAAGSVIGPTTEPRATVYPGAAFGEGYPWDHMLERAAAMFSAPIEPKEVWAAVRLEESTARIRMPRLTAFGSKGYLLAPRAASDWAHATWAPDAGSVDA